MSYNSKYTGAEVEEALGLAKTALQEHQDLSGYQPKLFSGTNIKTINGQSVLGSGDIVIEGGSGTSSDVYVWAPASIENGTITLEELELIKSSKLVVVSYMYALYVMCRRVNIPRGLFLLVAHIDTDYVTTYNFTFTNNETGASYSSTMEQHQIGPYPLVNHGTIDTTFTLTPNTFHVWSEVDYLDLSLGEETSGVANEYVFQFTSGVTGTTLTLPDSVMWASDFSIDNGITYQISILNGIATHIAIGGEIEFRIDGYGDFNVTKGVTWQHFVDSGYNNGAFSVDNGFVYLFGDIVCTDEYLSNAVNPNDVIIDGYIYHYK